MALKISSLRFGILGVAACLSLCALPSGVAQAGDGQSIIGLAQSAGWDVAPALDSASFMDEAVLVHPWDNSDYTDSSQTVDPGHVGRRPKPIVSPGKQVDAPTLYRTAAEGVQPGGVTALHNYPNPFNAQTRIAFTLKASGQVEIRIYNLIGQTVRSISLVGLTSGAHGWVWDGRNGQGRTVPSGVYFYQVVTQHGAAIGKMVLLK